MRDLDSNSFNSVLYDKLVELKRIIENDITPENISFFNPIIINKAEGFLGKDYKYDNFSNINSIDAYKLNSMINYLKINKFEYKHIFKKITIEKDIYEAAIDIPEGFDGRNSMCSVIIEDKGRTTEQEPYGIRPEVVFNRAAVDKDFTCYLVRNKDNWKIITRQFKTIFPNSISDIIVTGFLWRRR